MAVLQAHQACWGGIMLQSTGVGPQLAKVLLCKTNSLRKTHGLIHILLTSMRLTLRWTPTSSSVPLMARTPELEWWADTRNQVHSLMIGARR
jgi:hypothetical protein